MVVVPEARGIVEARAILHNSRMSRRHLRPVPAAVLDEVRALVGEAPRRDLLIECLHRIQDAQGCIDADRLAAGDLDGALALYEAAINDPALRNDGFAHAPEQVYADVSRFAAFRLVLIDLLQGNAERAAGRLAWLQANHPDAAATSAAGRPLGSVLMAKPNSTS